MAAIKCEKCGGDMVLTEGGSVAVCKRCGNRRDRSAMSARLNAIIRCSRGIIAAGESHVVGLRLDGTVLAAGENQDGQCNVSGWRDIVAVSAGRYHTVGLKADGTVVAVGGNSWGQCEVSGWRHIAAISAGSLYTLGLRWDGTVVCAYGGLKDVKFTRSWRDVAYFATNGFAAVTKDGKVLTDLYTLAETITGWRDVLYYDQSDGHALAGLSDGTIKAVCMLPKDRDAIQVGTWSKRSPLIALIAGYYHSVGLHYDGTVSACGGNLCGECDVSAWRDIVAVSAGNYFTVGLKADGTVIAAGNKKNGDVSGWRLFQDFRDVEPYIPSRPATREEALADNAAEMDALRAWSEAMFEERKKMWLFKRFPRKHLKDMMATARDEIEYRRGERKREISGCNLP